MAIPEIDVTPRPVEERLRAYEMFLSAAVTGKQTSMRAIAATVGVSAMTIGRWREVDEWDTKVSRVLSEAATGAETTSNALKRRVRQGLLDGLSQLQSIAKNADRDADKIAAVRCLADIALKFEAITAAATAGQGEQAQKVVEFDDTLPEEEKWQETSERPLKQDVSADAPVNALGPAPPLESLPTPLLPSPEEALVLLQEAESKGETETDS